jgi:hypothetical protein
MTSEDLADPDRLRENERLHHDECVWCVQEVATCTCGLLDLIDELAAEVARFVPARAFESFIAGDGGRSIRGRSDLYEKVTPDE